MKKVVLKIQETLRYQREVPVMIPDDMNQEALNAVLDTAQCGAESVDDIIYRLRRHGIQQNEPYDSNLDSPDWSEAECDEYDFPDGGSDSGDGT
ncbi:hypothetical protein [Cohnella massiliensis]|uniref:hypothetical protein n=1 Tax=Cohnella massiliensis TaxID=1816691 RepID=UPI0009BB8B29|nr:hypothetical protein [Cohnella massiliensis]